MESNESARDLLREADRAEAAPWVDFPPTPAWYPASVGIWGAALTLVLGVLEEPWRPVATLALVAIEVAFIRWYRSYRGTMPKGPMPQEMRRPALLMALGLAAIVVAAGALVMLGQPWVAAGLVLVTAIPLTWWYERAYAAAAERAKARLG